VADSNSETTINNTDKSISSGRFRTNTWSFYPVLAICMVFAFWSVWWWYYLRLSSSQDEIYGVIALFAIAGLSFTTHKQSNSDYGLIIATLLILFFAISYPFLPPLIRAVIAVTAFTLLICSWRFGQVFHFGIWSLFLLSLPIVASMQFYLGFPLRVMIGEAIVFLLKLNGLAVVREGVCLHFGDKLIWIDAPCSGVKMLWTGFLLTAVLITLYRFSFAKSLISMTVAFGIIILGNIFRGTGLFYLEAGIVEMPDFAHSGIGVVCFIFTCLGIVFAIQTLDSKTKIVEETVKARKFTKISIVFFLACLWALVTPLFIQKTIKIPNAAHTGFPKDLAGRQLQELTLTERELYFLEDFPGEVKRFTDGEREIIIRFVTEATRKLHPSTDCFSAIGYQISSLPLKLDPYNHRWSCFSAVKGTQNLQVCERIYTRQGDSWTDVSSWYWSALSNLNPDGYWAITVAENKSE